MTGYRPFREGSRLLSHTHHAIMGRRNVAAVTKAHRPQLGNIKTDFSCYGARLVDMGLAAVIPSPDSSSCSPCLGFGVLLDPPLYLLHKREETGQGG